jgi:HSP20 family protein
MSRVTVKKVPNESDRSLPIFDELALLADRIRERAYELFCDRGSGDGRDVDDWLTAEREICWPAAELEEDEDEFELKVALAGFEPHDISVVANPRELIVKAEHTSERKDDDGDDESAVHWTEFHRESVYRRVELPSPIDVNNVEAKFKHGLLEIEAPKLGEAQLPAKRVKVDVSSAA